MSCGNESVFGNQSSYIKFQGSDIVAIEGVNTVERLIASDLRIPYKQILKSRVILKAGQVNYLLNHLGMGDNATFLAIKAKYNSSSVNEEDNYILWNYYNDFSKQFPMAQFMLLTGNSSNRIKQLYLTNPSSKYSVILDIMVASIDDAYNFFPDTVNQTATTFTGLSWTDITSYVVGESLVLKDTSGDPLIYLQLSNIQSISRVSNIVTIDDLSLGTILFVFVDESNAAQAHSGLSYVLSNSNVSYPTTADIISPVVYFYEFVGNTSSNASISFNGATGSSFSTSDGFTFSTSISLSTYGTLSSTNLSTLLISNVSDNRDGLITLTQSNIIISGTAGIVSNINMTGTYSMTFNLSDLALNNLIGVNMTLNII
jgi:hypothetical protein